MLNTPVSNVRLYDRRVIQLLYLSASSALTYQCCFLAANEVGASSGAIPLLTVGIMLAPLVFFRHVDVSHSDKTQNSYINDP
jgi:NhaP-type Na+/H+ or K+/H+ antiporter